MTITNRLLDSGLDALDEPAGNDPATIIELGGLMLRGVEDSGLDDLGENEGDEEESAGDGRTPLELSISPRAIELVVTIQPTGDTVEARAASFTAALTEIKRVMAPLPYRQGERLLRWRRIGEYAKRLMVQPALGKAVQVVGISDGKEGGEDRQLYHHMNVKLRLTAADPIITSDLYHRATFTVGQTQTIPNAGVLAAVQPSGWWLEAAAGTVLENLDQDEYVNFPTGPVTVARDRLIAGPDASYGQCTGADGAFFPRWPVLYPGDNTIRASKACTLYWRDT